MDLQTINNLISFVACAIFEGDKEKAIFAAKGLDCPKEVKDHIISIFTNLKVKNMKLLRFNQQALEISNTKFIGAFPKDNLIEVHYYDDDDNEQTALGYHLMR